MFLYDIWVKDIWPNIHVAFYIVVKVVITTQVHDIATLGVSSHSLKLQPLEGNAARTLHSEDDKWIELPTKRLI